MTKEFALHIAQTFMVISAIAMLISPLLFREGSLIFGVITRKGIITMAVCFWLFLLSAATAAWIYDPTQTLGVNLCLGGFAIVSVFYFITLYLRYPHNRQKSLWLQREREKLLMPKNEKKENRHKDKDGVE